MRQTNQQLSKSTFFSSRPPTQRKASVRKPSYASSFTMSPSSSEERQSRERFALYIKILFKLLDESDDKLMHEQAKLVVFTFTRSNRKATLIHDIQKALKHLLAESIWKKAEKLTDFYLNKKKAYHHHAAFRLALFNSFATTIDLEPTPIRTLSSSV
jgi:hypothetical protein